MYYRISYINLIFVFKRIYEFAAQLLSQLARITLFVHYQKPFDRIVIEIPSRCHSFRKIQLRECNKRPRCKRNVGVDCAVFARETPERRKICIVIKWQRGRRTQRLLDEEFSHLYLVNLQRVTTLVSVAASCHAHGNFHLYQWYVYVLIITTVRPKRKLCKL